MKKLRYEVHHNL